MNEALNLRIEFNGARILHYFQE